MTSSPTSGQGGAGPNFRTLLQGALVLIALTLGIVIIYPVIQAARPVGVQTQALSNGKQLGTAMLLYEADFDRLPTKDSWGKAIVSYLKNSNVVAFQPRREGSWCAKERPARYFAMSERLSNAKAIVVGDGQDVAEILLFGSANVEPYRYGPVASAMALADRQLYVFVSREGVARLRNRIPASGKLD